MAHYDYRNLDDDVLLAQLGMITSTLHNLQFELSFTEMDWEETQNYLKAKGQYQDRHAAAMREINRRGLVIEVIDGEIVD